MLFYVIPKWLKLNGAGAEKGFPLPAPSLANLLEEGRSRQCIRRSTPQPYNFGSTDPCLHNVFTVKKDGSRIVRKRGGLPPPLSNDQPPATTFTHQLLSWSAMYNAFIIRLMNTGRLFASRGLQLLSSTNLSILRLKSALWSAAGRKKGNKVVWGDLPPELWTEIGKRMPSRLDILRFRSVCTKLRSSLPLARRFPLWVPRPPDMTELPNPRSCPFVITEFSTYKCPGMSGVLHFEDKNPAGKLYFNTSVPQECSSCPMISLMESRTNPYSRMSWLSTTYCLRRDLSCFGSWKEVHTAFVICRFAQVIVLISSNATDGVNPCYANASDLTAVALSSEVGRLALLRLGGSYKDLVWETGFCDQVFKGIVSYRGQLCALDLQDNVFVMDYNSLKMTQVSPPWDRPILDVFAANSWKFSFNNHT